MNKKLHLACGIRQLCVPSSQRGSHLVSVITFSRGGWLRLFPGRQNISAACTEQLNIAAGFTAVV